MGWDADLYDQEQKFVSEFGRNLLDLVDASPGERIWDLGCGTGTLAAALAKSGATVIGTDVSPNMIAQSKKNYPGIEFRVEDAVTATFKQPFDKVFSNAVFHWIPEQIPLLTRIRESLKPGGKLVCEMGARGNIQSLEDALASAMARRNQVYETIFYFPSLTEYVSVLATCGFDTSFIREYDRPTPFQPGKKGLSDWIRQFYHKPLSLFGKEEAESIISEMETELRPILWKHDRWIGDYRRLLFVASAVC